MALDGSDIDVTAPQALLDALGLDAIDGSIMAARMCNDGDPPTISTDVAPSGAPNGGCVVDITGSRIGEAIAAAYQPAQLPDVNVAASSAFSGEDLTAPAPVAPDVENNSNLIPDLPTLEPKTWGDNS